MGFSENGSKRAALAVGNSSAEAATNWVMEHMGDDDFNDPLPAPGGCSRVWAVGARGCLAGLVICDGAHGG